MALPKRATSGPTFDMFVGNFPATLAAEADVSNMITAASIFLVYHHHHFSLEWIGLTAR